MAKANVEVERSQQFTPISIRRNPGFFKVSSTIEATFFGRYKQLRAGDLHREGTHVDFIRHFNPQGREITREDLNMLNGDCFVVDYHGDAAELHTIPQGTERVLIRSFPHRSSDYQGRRQAETTGLDLSAAQYLREIGVRALGITGPTIGDERVHLSLHGDEGKPDSKNNRAIIVMEDIVLPEDIVKNGGRYMLTVAPLIPLTDLHKHEDALPVEAKLTPVDMAA